MTSASDGSNAAGGGAEQASTSGRRAEKSPVYAKKLHLGHFAFMRSVVQGIDTRGSWDRYLRLEGEHDDIRNVRRTIQWIRDEFAAAAKRHDRYGTARLVQIDASRIPEKAERLPTLEEFADEYGLHDFSEAEQLEQYHERYGARTGSESRRARLIAKQLEALTWLESLEAQAPPKATDPLNSWINPDLAAHFEAVGIRTIGQLVTRINGLGMRWWFGIPAIGLTKARRVMDWLRANEPTIGLRIGAHVNVKRSALTAGALSQVVPRATAIRPLEKFVLPAELDGANGTNRAPQHLCQIPAKNDLEAIFVWIKAKPGLSPEEKAGIKRRRGIDPLAPDDIGMEWLAYLSHTQRAYRKEAERFILWAVVQRKSALSSMTAEDCSAYVAFLANPVPAETWCGPRSREKWSPLWRPFEGPLSPQTQRQAVTILKSLYRFLVDKGYLLGNPWQSVAKPDAHFQIDDAKAFTPSQWQFVEAQLATLPDTSASKRMRIALRLLYTTGLRVSEIVRLRVNDFQLPQHSLEPADGGGERREGWKIVISGRRKKARHLSIPKLLCEELSDNFASRGLDQDLAHPDNHGAYILGKATDIAERAPWVPDRIRTIDPKEGISPATLAKEIRRFFNDCAATIRRDDSKAADAFMAASAYWIRHTYGSNDAEVGMPST